MRVVCVDLLSISAAALLRLVRLLRNKFLPGYLLYLQDSQRVTRNPAHQRRRPCGVLWVSYGVYTRTRNGEKYTVLGRKMPIYRGEHEINIWGHTRSPVVFCNRLLCISSSLLARSGFLSFVMTSIGPALLLQAGKRQSGALSPSGGGPGVYHNRFVCYPKIVICGLNSLNVPTK